jgi:hypothetical protein
MQAANSIKRLVCFLLTQWIRSPPLRTVQCRQVGKEVDLWGLDRYHDDKLSNPATQRPLLASKRSLFSRRPKLAAH